MVTKAIKAGVSPRKGMAMGMYASGGGKKGGKPAPKPKGGKKGY